MRERQPRHFVRQIEFVAVILLQKKRIITSDRVGWRVLAGWEPGARAILGFSFNENFARRRSRGKPQEPAAAHRAARTRSGQRRKRRGSRSGARHGGIPVSDP